MIKQKVHAYRFEILSLSPLKMMLMDARRDLPPHVSKKDVNEELALRLSEKMRTGYRRVFRGMVKANV